jgi:hypothetical protein
MSVGEVVGKKEWELTKPEDLDKANLAQGSG